MYWRYSCLILFCQFLNVIELYSGKVWSEDVLEVFLFIVVLVLTLQKNIGKKLAKNYQLIAHHSLKEVVVENRSNQEQKKKKKKKKKKKEEGEDEEEGDDEEYVTADEGEEDNDKQKLLAKDYIGNTFF